MIEQIILTLAVVAAWTFVTGFLWIFAVAGIGSRELRSRWLPLFWLILVVSLIATAFKAVVMTIRIWA